MKNFLSLIFILVSLQGFSQNKNEIPFIRHLINKEYYKEATYLIEKENYSYDDQQMDSLYYYLGWAHYSLKNLKQSTVAFLKVRNESPFFLKSYFFAGYNQIYLENYDKALDIFGQMNIKNEPHLSLMNFEQSGIDMLQGNWQNGKERLKLVNKENAFLNEHITALEDICLEHENHRSKSPVVAGIMSGIIPGSGKIYAGKTGSGIASMIGTVGFGLIAWENYRKLGFTNAKTIIFGSIFIVNYTSNIYGSIISVKIIENEYKNTLQNQILFQLHIPLRYFFE